jgi:hypothetical protein
MSYRNRRTTRLTNHELRRQSAQRFADASRKRWFDLPAAERRRRLQQTMLEECIAQLAKLGFARDLTPPSTPRAGDERTGPLPTSQHPQTEERP